MTRIHQLDEQLANKIAAGEVIERPGSVIKELVENAIDAASRHITVLVEEGGTVSMTVIDDGIGMDRMDAITCFSRHATSKIVTDQDLFHITTLGFRGEAIPSIASISHFELETSDGTTSTRVNYEFGKQISVEECTLNKGTKITVTKLFQNVPARLKYLKSINSEFAVIYTYIERLALSHPEIGFTLEHNHKTIFQTSGSNNRLEVISQIYGMNTARNMIPVDFGNDEFHITGYISKIDTSRASKNHIITLVNSRYVRHRKTINTINDIYRKYLPEKRFPITVLNIDVEPFLVDVNVHPSKLEVKFSKENALRELLIEGINSALNKSNLIYEEKNRETEKPKVQQTQMVFETPVIPEPVNTLQEETEPYIIEPEPVYIPVSQVEERPIKEKIYAKGQVRGTYIFGENEKGMYLVDQHAAQERINYEKFRQKYEEKDLSQQPMLVPLLFEYPESEYLILEERQKYFEELGIHFDPIGKNTFCVRSLPVWMKNIDEKLFIDEMVEEVLTKDYLDVMALQDLAIATLACKASLKGNTYLTLHDMQVILDNLMRCENPYVCPHGRPVIIFYSDKELEKLFKRIMS